MGSQEGGRGGQGGLSSGKFIHANVEGRGGGNEESDAAMGA